MSIETSLVFLIDVATGQAVEAELLDGITEQQLVHWEDEWVPALRDVVERMKAAGMERTKWPQSLHWNWRRKAQSLVLSH